MKKVFALLMAAVMVLGLFAGCGAESNSETTNASTAGDSASNGASAAEDTIKVGAIGPLTGDYALYGNAVAWGIQVAIDEINANGSCDRQLCYNEDDIYGMLYYLTGKCYINWKDY